MVAALARSGGDDAEPEVDEVGRVRLGPRDDLEVVGLVLLGDADLEEAVELGPVLAAAGRRLDEALDVGEAEDRGQARARHAPVRSLPFPVGEAERLEPGDRGRRRGPIEARERERVLVGSRADPAAGGAVVGPRIGQLAIGRAEQDLLLAVAHEAGLHQELDVAVGIGAGHVEPGGRALGPFAEQLLDEPVADVAGIDQPHRIELHDRPLVAHGLALDADETSDPALVLVDEHQVVRAKRAEREAEQAEHADRWSVDWQAERSRVRPIRLAQARQLTERGQVGQPRRADLAAAARRTQRAHCTELPRRADRLRRVGCGRRPEPSPGSSCSAAIVAINRWKRVSPASSGWKAVASTLRCRTATTRPSSSRDRTSTSGPVRSMIGARMKTAWTGVPPRTGTSRSASNESSWRPNALRSTVTSRSGRIGGSPPAISVASTIIPAPVP